jgi:hypothetical protein
MAIHQKLDDLAAEVVEEYLLAAEQCMAFRKQSDGGRLGYPAALLLFCVIEALAHSRKPKTGEPFRFLTEQPFNLNLTAPQIKNIEQWFRNLLVHNAIIAPGTLLAGDDVGEPFEFSDAGELNKVRIAPLFGLVKDAWERFDRNCLGNLMHVLEPMRLPQNPAALPQLSSATPPASGLVEG